MCGISGIISSTKNNDSIEQVKSMVTSLRHRGPDEFGIYNGKHACLGHARLSIIDLSTGSQPIHNEDKSLWIIFNGEIFNYPELRDILVKKGHVFKTTSDTEVILHGYEEYGVHVLEQLNGQFAFAIWDSKNNECFIARDRIGIRPLFYFQKEDSLIFASEIKALLSTGEIGAEIDPPALSQIFTLWTTLPSKTIFKNIFQLPAGHYLIWKNGDLKVQQYWQLSFPPKNGYEDRPFNYWAQEFKGLLIDASLIRLRADVPVGAYLSGGLDSSVIAAIIKNYTSNSLKTFSISFEDRDFDESNYQKLMVNHLGTDHRIHRVTNEEIFKHFKQTIWHTEIPILRTAPVPLMLLSRLVRENNFKVVLTGEGADEFLGGYNIFKETLVRHFWSRFPESKYRPLLLQKLYPYIKTISVQNRRLMEQFFARDLMQTENPIYSHLIRWRNTSALRSFLSEEIIAHLHGYDPVEAYIQTLPAELHHWAPLSKAQYIEIELFLTGYLLSSQGDRMAMANSVEGRFPFLDHRLIELTSRIPPKFKLRILNEKYILKKTMGRLLPEQIFNRPKQPYRAPITACFYQETDNSYVSELLSSKNLKNVPYFDSNAVMKLVRKWERGKGILTSERENMAFVGILSTLLIDDLFVEKRMVPKRNEAMKAIKVIQEEK